MRQWDVKSFESEYTLSLPYLVCRRDERALVEEDGAEKGPDLGVTPVFGEDVCRVAFAGTECVGNGAGGDGLANGVEGEHMVTLVQFSMGSGGAVDDRFVISSKDGCSV